MNLECKPEDITEALKDYEKKIVKNGILKSEKICKSKKLEREYLKTLKERPWETCSCPMCKELGAETYNVAFVTYDNFC